MSNINEMFTAVENNEVTTNKRALAGTAQLMAVTNEIVSTTIRTLNDNLDNYRELFEESKTSHSAMDKLLDLVVNYESIDVAFIKELDDAVIEGMLKSQQSKRSRAKGKTMTMDNYKNMMSGAVAENLIRKTTGKTKQASGVRRASGQVEFSEEELEALKENQEQLKKELRNVQSKKSIMKAKADFDEESERWQQLLVAEEQLKSIRVSTGRTRVVKVDETKDKLQEALADVDLDHIKAGDSKALLEQIKNMISAQ